MLVGIRVGVIIIINIFFPPTGMSESILQLFRRQHPPRGPGLVVSSRFRELSEKPGYLSFEDGSKELRNFYVGG